MSVSIENFDERDRFRRIDSPTSVRAFRSLGIAHDDLFVRAGPPPGVAAAASPEILAIRLEHAERRRAKRVESVRAERRRLLAREAMRQGRKKRLTVQEEARRQAKALSRVHDQAFLRQVRRGDKKLKQVLKQAVRRAHQQHATELSLEQKRLRAEELQQLKAEQAAEWRRKQQEALEESRREEQRLRKARSRLQEMSLRQQQALKRQWDRFHRKQRAAVARTRGVTRQQMADHAEQLDRLRAHQQRQIFEREEHVRMLVSGEVAVAAEEQRVEREHAAEGSEEDVPEGMLGRPPAVIRRDSDDDVASAPRSPVRRPRAHKSAPTHADLVMRQHAKARAEARQRQIAEAAAVFEEPLPPNPMLQRHQSPRERRQRAINQLEVWDAKMGGRPVGDGPPSQRKWVRLMNDKPSHQLRDPGALEQQWKLELATQVEAQRRLLSLKQRVARSQMQSAMLELRRQQHRAQVRQANQERVGSRILHVHEKLERSEIHRQAFEQERLWKQQVRAEKARLVASDRAELRARRSRAAAFRREQLRDKIHRDEARIAAVEHEKQKAIRHRETLREEAAERTAFHMQRLLELTERHPDRLVDLDPDNVDTVLVQLGAQGARDDGGGSGASTPRRPALPPPPPGERRKSPRQRRRRSTTAMSAASSTSVSASPSPPPPPAFSQTAPPALMPDSPALQPLPTPLALRGGATDDAALRRAVIRAGGAEIEHPQVPGVTVALQAGSNASTPRGHQQEVAEGEEVFVIRSP